MMIDFSDLRVFCVFTLIAILLIICSVKFKKSFPALISLLAYVIVLTMTAFMEEYTFVNRTIHFVVNYAGIVVSIVPYILIDDIETRRKIVTTVFENRYKKK